ncbi:hypothetical protein DU002_00500 [Corallincola holothuriorum]|uniref:RND efflux pump membrane fusion protein barrel-sandwich domain-containing protein n=1 Tax=Corallincola holothuriorum TaxID=2282215 RepID=A0A368NRN9_9GAMM|nr:hypothetical protein [Corallincola holothuriorum]RCU52485.1 hypothetical protein DU002_00500 [Corallincola holothuriorum]
MHRTQPSLLRPGFILVWPLLLLWQAQGFASPAECSAKSPEHLSYTGKVLTNDLTNIRTPVPGLVHSMPESTKAGTIVKRGDLLALIEAHELNVQVLELETELNRIRVERLKLNVLFGNTLKSAIGQEKKLTPALEVNQAAEKAAIRKLSYLREMQSSSRITAPFDIKILKQHIYNDAYVGQGDVIIEAQRVDRQLVQFSVDRQINQKLNQLIETNVPLSGLYLDDGESREPIRTDQLKSLLVTTNNGCYYHWLVEVAQGTSGGKRGSIQYPLQPGMLVDITGQL